MDVSISLSPSNTVAEINLIPGEVCTTESGSMIAMSSNLNIETSSHSRSNPGFLRAVKRMFAGQSFFMNHFSTQADGGKLYLSPTLPGDICAHTLNQSKIIIQSASFLACDEGIQIDTGWQGFKSLLSGERIFWLEATGSGILLLSAFGAIYCVDVDDNYVIDTGHIVAFEESLDFKISKASKGWLSSWLSGEGLVCKFKGKGKLWCQSHNPVIYGQALRRHLRPKNR